MPTTKSYPTGAGQRFKQALAAECPLQIVGVINAYCAVLAASAGYRALYISGAGVANASHGIPDLGITLLHDVLEDTKRITAITELPVLVDMDTGWGGAFNIARSIRELIRAAAAGTHIEDQVAQKRCGHRPNKAVVSCQEMVDRIKAAVDARTDPDFILMARTDAFQIEGLPATIERCQAYVEAGADAIFAEAMTDLELYRTITSSVAVPVLANITEFGATPLYNLQELDSVGIKMALYPLSAFRAMNQAALKVYTGLRNQGTQKALIEDMQTREELYKFLDYHSYEAKLDSLFAKDKKPTVK